MWFFNLNMRLAASKHPRAECTLYFRSKQTAMKIFYMRLSPSNSKNSMEKLILTFIFMSSAADPQESDATLSTKSINRAEFQAYCTVTRSGDLPRLCVRHQPEKQTLAIESPYE